MKVFNAVLGDRSLNIDLMKGKSFTKTELKVTLNNLLRGQIIIIKRLS